MTGITILQCSPVPAYFCCGKVESPIQLSHDLYRHDLCRQHSHNCFGNASGIFIGMIMPLAFPQLLQEQAFLQSFQERYTLTNLAFKRKKCKEEKLTIIVVIPRNHRHTRLKIVRTVQDAEDLDEVDKKLISIDTDIQIEAFGYIYVKE